MKLGENIYKYRTERNLSQTALADALEVSRQSISKWENSTAVPELDKLIKMSILFEITIDDLVFGKEETQNLDQKVSDPVDPTRSSTSTKTVIGLIMLGFGMIFFLLSIFWGDHLYFGEVVGELTSVAIVMISVAIIATDNFKVLGLVTIIYVLYTAVCFGIMHVTSISNYIFTGVSGFIILIWFIVWGTKANKQRST